MAHKKTKRNGGFGVLFWMAFILFVVALYLHNRSDIQQVLENTGLVETLAERLSPRNGEDNGAPAVDRPEPEPEAEPELETPQIELVPPRSSPVPEPAQASEPPKPDAGISADSPAVASPAEPEAPVAEPRARTLDLPLYFIRVTDDGTIFPDRVLREVAFVDTPLSSMVQVLISGPSAAEIERGLHNLIPKDTRLLSATVRGGVAYLNFNEAFQFNPLGIEGYLAQLKQIVYSTTEFPTVNSVQILIEGQEREYLGGDGVYIGRPLSRNSFG